MEMSILPVGEIDLFQVPAELKEKIKQEKLREQQNVFPPNFTEDIIRGSDKAGRGARRAQGRCKNERRKVIRVGFSY